MKSFHFCLSSLGSELIGRYWKEVINGFLNVNASMFTKLSLESRQKQFFGCFDLLLRRLARRAESGAAAARDAGIHSGCTIFTEGWFWTNLAHNRLPTLSLFRIIYSN